MCCALHRTGDRPGHRRALPGPIFLTTAGERLDRHGSGRIVRRVAWRAGLAKKTEQHTLRHVFITATQMSGVASCASFGRVT